MFSVKRSSIILAILFIVLGNISCFGQIVFSKGYLINNRNQKIECLIENYDWMYNPVKIEYKIQEASDIVTAGIDSIKEFGINDFSRFVRAMVKIDRSPVGLNSLSDTKKPLWSEETLFLNELVCGKAGLWIYTDSERFWFFYTIDQSEPEQLVYKEYLVNDMVATNRNYRPQLYTYLKNDNTKNFDVKTLEYNEKDLVKYFKLYNKTADYCPRTDFVKKERETFNLKVAGSVNSSNMSFFNGGWNNDVYSLGNKINWMAGIEVEWFLPFNKNIWSVVLSPSYEHIYNSKQFSQRTVSINIQSVTFPIGGRYTKHFNSQLKCFVSAYVVPALCFDFDNTFKYSTVYNLPANEGMSYILGAGVAYRNLGLEFRYYSNRQLVNRYIYWETNYQKVALTVSYKLLSIKGK